MRLLSAIESACNSLSEQEPLLSLLYSALRSFDIAVVSIRVWRQSSGTLIRFRSVGDTDIPEVMGMSRDFWV